MLFRSAPEGRTWAGIPKRAIGGDPPTCRRCVIRFPAISISPTARIRPLPDGRLSVAAASHYDTAASKAMRAAFSPIMIDGALVLPDVKVGMIEASATRRPAIPWTRS